MAKSLATLLVKREKILLSPSKILLAMSLALGVSALFALENFSSRIAATIQRDSKSILAADFQLHAFRPFTPDIWAALSDLKQHDQIIEQTDFVSSARFGEKDFITVSVRALGGHNYPYYGTFETLPAMKIEDLDGRALAFADKGLEARGFKIGDAFKLGSQEFKIAAFIQAEPQTVSTAFSLGPRVIIHQSMVGKTQLLGRGARAFYQLLIKSNESSAVFKQAFRKKVPDVHWRLITPEHANQQAAKVIQTIKNYLSLVGLVALFLGGVGLYVIFRAQFLARLNQYLTLRCLGASKNSILGVGLIYALPIFFLGTALGLGLGYFLENYVSHYAKVQMGVDLAAAHTLNTVVLTSFISLLVALCTALLPLRDALEVPILKAIHEDEAQTVPLSRKTLQTFVFLSLVVVFLVSRDLKMTFYFFAAMGFILTALAGLSKLLFKVLEPLKNSKFEIRHAYLNLVRKKSRSEFLVICLGMGLFLAALVMHLSYCLQGQLSLSERGGVANFFVIGVAAENLAPLKVLLKNASEAPVTQARLRSLHGQEIGQADEATKDKTNNEDDESMERFYQTREYFVTRRNSLTVGERLYKGSEIFGAKVPGVVRVSIEESFASRADLHLGDEFEVEIAGVPLKTQVQSIRKVDWFNFQPNFFLVFNDEDLADAPMDYIVFSRLSESELPLLQNAIGQKFPQMTTLDGTSIAKRLAKLLNQLALSVLAVSLFSLGSCLFVFIGMIISRRSELIKEVSLWKLLGLSSARMIQLYMYESLVVSLLAVAVVMISSNLVVYGLCRFLLEIPFEFQPFGRYVILAVGMPLFLGLGFYLNSRKYFKMSSLELLRESEHSVA